jgi:two-component system sensor histidine kinase VicK
MTLQSIFSSTNVSGSISFVYDLNARQFVFIDEELTKLLNIDSKSTQDILTLIHDDDVENLKQDFENLLKGSFKGNVEFRLNIEEGERWLGLTPLLVRSANEAIVAGNVIDITADVANRRSLEKFANKKNSILSILSHDLRGPLGIAQMIAQSLNKSTTDVSIINQSQSLAKIIKQALDLVNDLIQREEAETIRVEVVKRRLDIAKKLKEYVDELKHSEDALNRIITFSSSDESIYAHLDEAKFMQIMNNLVTNALKFTHPGDKISISVTDKPEAVLFTFSDTGVGIPEEFHADLFQKFTPARRKGLNGEPSIGMGLSIIKTILEWHEGKIWF